MTPDVEHVYGERLRKYIKGLDLKRLSDILQGAAILDFIDNNLSHNMLLIRPGSTRQDVRVEIIMKYV